MSLDNLDIMTTDDENELDMYFEDSEINFSADIQQVSLSFSLSLSLSCLSLCLRPYRHLTPSLSELTFLQAILASIHQADEVGLLSESSKNANNQAIYHLTSYLSPLISHLVPLTSISHISSLTSISHVYFR